MLTCLTTKLNLPSVQPWAHQTAIKVQQPKTTNRKTMASRHSQRQRQAGAHIRAPEDVAPVSGGAAALQARLYGTQADVHDRLAAHAPRPPPRAAVTMTGATHAADLGAGGSTRPMRKGAMLVPRLRLEQTSKADHPASFTPRPPPSTSAPSSARTARDVTMTFATTNGASSARSGSRSSRRAPPSSARTFRHSGRTLRSARRPAPGSQSARPASTTARGVSFAQPASSTLQATGATAGAGAGAGAAAGAGGEGTASGGKLSRRALLLQAVQFKSFMETIEEDPLYAGDHLL